MTQYLFSNNPLTTLAAPISTGSTSLSVLAGAGSEFPNPTTGQGFLFTLQKAGNASIFEICLCTARSGDNFTTIVRAQEGTSALTWNAGDTVTLLITAGGLNSFLQTSVAQPELYTYSADVGSANNYSVVLTPALSLLYVGQKYRFIAAHSNTGGCLFNGEPLLLPSGAQIPAGTIVAGGYYEAIYVGNSTYQLNLALNYGQVAFTGSATAVTQAITDNSTNIATTAYVKGLVNNVVNGGYNIGSNQFRFGTVNNSGANATANFLTAFSNGCYNIQLTIRGNTGVEFWCHSPTGGSPSSPTATQFSHYANANTAMDYFAIGH